MKKQQSVKKNYERAAKNRLTGYVCCVLGHNNNGLKLNRKFEIFAESTGLVIPSTKKERLRWLVNEYKNGNKFLKVGYEKLSTQRKLRVKRKKTIKNVYKTKAWYELRAKRLEIDNKTCQHCGSKKNLHVHHLSYSRVEENYLIVPIDQLLTVCKPCHEKIHGREFDS